MLDDFMNYHPNIFNLDSVWHDRASVEQAVEPVRLAAHNCV
jgi:hypothetical protein